MAVRGCVRVTGVRRRYLFAWLLLIMAVVVPTVVRFSLHSTGPTVTIVSPEGPTRSVSLVEMKRMSTVTRRGVYQNQYETWRDEGVYTGVRLVDLIGTDADYEAVSVVATDGYEALIERTRVEDSNYPIVLAYAFDGVEVPDWGDGFRIAVLPEHGSVGNEEYGVDSAGSYWVKRVVRLILK